MTLEQFRQLADIWGGDIDRWPAAVQGDAREFAASAEGAAILDDQLGLDRLFSLAPEVSDARAGRIGFAVLQRIADTDRSLPWLRRIWSPASLFPAASLAFSAIAGLWLATALPYQQPQEALSVVSMLFDSSAVTLWGVQ